jgi:predicted DNA-binding ribbon-helix-helix protein
MTGRLVTRNIAAQSHRTTMRLEPELWDGLQEVCMREGVTPRALTRSIDRKAGPGTRTSAVRIHVLEYFRAAATKEGHAAAGHGAGEYVIASPMPPERPVG